MREEEQQQREAMLTLQRQQEASEAAVARAKEDALSQTRREVAEATRKTFESITKELPAKQKDKVWEKVSAKISSATEAFATALADRTHTEQDLQNIQAELNRGLVAETDAELTISATQMLADDFVASVQRNLVPEAVKHYSGQVEQRVGNRLRSEADRFINSTRTHTQQEMAKNGQRAERARGLSDGVRGQLAAAPDEKRLAEAAKQIGELERLFTDAAKQCVGVEATEDVAQTAQDALAIIGELKTGVAQAQQQHADARATVKYVMGQNPAGN
jgi:hypothetical protein